MPLYMDMHTIDGGVAADDVAKAHIADLQTQGKHNVTTTCATGWTRERTRSSASSRRRQQKQP